MLTRRFYNTKQFTNQSHESNSMTQTYLVETSVHCRQRIGKQVKLHVKHSISLFIVLETKLSFTPHII
jgi:hypothetical protein